MRAMPWIVAIRCAEHCHVVKTFDELFAELSAKGKSVV